MPVPTHSLCNFDFCSGLEGWTSESWFLLKAVMCDLLVLTRKSIHPSFSCVRQWTQRNLLLWCLKFVSAQNVNSLQGRGTTVIVLVHGPRKGQGGGRTWARSGSKTHHPCVGRREAGRGSHSSLCPRPHAPQYQLYPSSSSGFLLSTPVWQSQEAWLFTLALPFLQANKKNPIMQTHRLTHKLLMWLREPTVTTLFNGIKVHLMLSSEFLIPPKAFPMDHWIDTSHRTSRRVRASSARREGCVTEFTEGYVCATVTSDATAVLGIHCQASCLGHR